MPGPSDDTLKQLTELSPSDWVERGGWPPAQATVIDADIATISGASDKVIRVAGEPEWLLAVDFQAGHDSAAKLPELLLYNSALYKRHQLPVRSLLVVLHKRADSPQLTGLYERGFRGSPFDVALRYQVLRVWQVPAERWLSGGLGLVPLAPLGDVRPDKLPEVVGRVRQRLKREARPADAKTLWVAMLILMGLRYERAIIETLAQGVHSMEESVIYQAILQEGERRGEARGKAEGEARGKAEEARRLLILFGRRQLGEPPVEVRANLDTITDIGRLEELAERLGLATSWAELLKPVTRLRRRRKPT